MAITNNRVQIPSKFSVLGNDGLISQPWSYYFNNVTANMPPIGSGYIIDGSAGTTGATTIYQGPAIDRSGMPKPNDIYVADDTGDVFTVANGQWQKQTPAFTGDVLKNAFSNTTTLATVNAAPGTYGDATTIPIVTVNEKGLVTDIQLVTVTNPSLNLPGKLGDFPFKVDIVGNAGANNLFNVDTFTVTYKHAFHQADAQPVLVCSVPANTVVSKVELTILTAFNGTNPTVSVGIGSGYNDLMATTDSNVGIISNWTVEPGINYVSAEDIYIAINAGSGSAGYALVVVSTVQI